MGANISSNTFSENGSREAATSVQHIPVSNPVVLFIHKSILWCSVKLLFWYKPIHESLYCPFRYTSRSYAV